MEPTTVTWMACETVAAGRELSVTVYAHESRKALIRSADEHAGLRVRSPSRMADLPPAQVKEYLYGPTPPEAAGSMTEP